MNIMPVMGIVDAQLRLQFLGRDVMLPSAPVMASDPAHDPNTLPVVEALKKPHVLSTLIQYTLAAAVATQHSEPYKL